MSRRGKWSVGITLLVLVAAVFVLAATRRGNRATAVRIEPVQRHDLVASVTASGQVQPRTKVDLSSDITGKIVRLAVHEGDMVTKGQFLLEIDPSQYEAAVQRQQAALAAARADLARAQANYDQAESSYKRSAAIKQQNPSLISDEQLEQLRTTMDVNKSLLEAAHFSIAQAEAGLKDAQSQLSKTVITAPMSGKVTRLNVEQGETAIMGTLNKDAATLLTISDMSALETIVQVDETDVSRISVGDSATVEIDALPNRTFRGRVVEISNSSIAGSAAAVANSDQAVDYEVKVLLLDAPPQTRPDYSATARIVTATREKALAIPIIALTVKENAPATPGGDTAAMVAMGGRTPPAKEVGKRDIEGVYVVGTDSHVTFRPVTVGITGDDYFEVVDGLKEGERIVTGSYQAIRTLHDGALVRASEPTATPATKGAGS
ncbi:MAG TPA: efflux RND transporter periplasmic adaptor subunit [Gemmatimonadaceae bacterium]|nr:efflux RND transporter periplasmic adaptor subunit [Gemmatimonadaceae bacterium]